MSLPLKVLVVWVDSIINLMDTGNGLSALKAARADPIIEGSSGLLRENIGAL